MSNTQANESTGFRQNMHGLREDAVLIAGDLKTIAGDTLSTARAGATELTDAARRATEAAKARLQDTSKVASDAAGTITDTIVKHPMASLGIAAGAGLVIGLLLHRSSR
jgi:ElaB/YqjD/DUF883 family membrane-anchored ribosome-binding protein